MTPFPCMCCGYPTLSKPPNRTYEICKVCFWEDDAGGGANAISLDTARRNFEAVGACEPRFRNNVRAPTDEETRNRVSRVCVDGAQ
jgi:Cysteine-rich CPCC